MPLCIHCKDAERASALQKNTVSDFPKIAQNIIQLETATLGPVNETSR